MKLAKTLYENKTRWALLEGDTASFLIGDPYESIEKSGESAPIADCKLLAPCDASKVVAIGKNYYDHAIEFGEEVPETPTIFIKPNTSIIADGEPVVYPPISKRVDFECELALVIKKRASHVKAADAKDYILGYTCLNDVTARDIQKSDAQWARGKGFDTFCPIGPILTDEIDPYAGIRVQTILNGEVKQDGNTKNMMWSIYELVEFITECMTLLPGDVVTTGTPVNVGPMLPGDTVTVRVEGIGDLVNPIIKGE